MNEGKNKSVSVKNGRKDTERFHKRMKQLEKDMAGHSQKTVLSPVLERDGSDASDARSSSGSETTELKEDDNWGVIQEVIAEVRRATSRY